MEHVLPDWRRVVLDPIIDVGNARADPDLFLNNFPAPLIVDEIQYAPELIAAIKRTVDRSRVPGRYVLTGSQQWQVLKSASESLAGRAVFLDLDSFSLAELAERPFEPSLLERFLGNPIQLREDARAAGPAAGAAHRRSARPLAEQLWRGFLPDIQTLEVEFVPDYQQAYFRSYVERDIRYLADVADWQQFGRFVRLAAALTAQEINRSHLGREIRITPQTAQRWLAMLTATFQWFEIPAFHANAIKRISSKPKGYMSDSGMVCYMQSISSAAALAGQLAVTWRLGTGSRPGTGWDVLSCRDQVEIPAHSKRYAWHRGVPRNVSVASDRSRPGNPPRRRGDAPERTRPGGPLGLVAAEISGAFDLPYQTLISSIPV